MADSLSSISAEFYETRVGTRLEKDIVGAVAAKAAAYIKNGRKEVLDVGCGTGSLAEKLFALCPEINYTGIDIHGGFLARAKTRLSGFRSSVLVQGDINHFRSGKKFDLVILCGTYHHIPHGLKEAALGTIARLMADEGALVVYEKVLPFYRDEKEYGAANRKFVFRRVLEQFFRGEIGVTSVPFFLKIGNIAGRKEYKVDYRNFLAAVEKYGFLLREEAYFRPLKYLFSKTPAGDIIFVFTYGKNIPK